MPPKRKVVYLSRFFEENVELVANMCVKCYQQEEVKVTAINRNFSNAIKSRRLESQQKRQKLITKESDSEEISSDFITEKLDETFEENASVSRDSEEPALDLHDIGSSELDENSSSNLTGASNVSLNEIRSNLDENTESQSIVENNNSFLDNDDKFDQSCDTLLNNKDCENISMKFEHRDTEATFKNIFKKSNNDLKYEDNSEIIPNDTSSSVVENNSDIILNNILNKINSKQQLEKDTSSDSSEENFNFFQDRQAKIENISAEKISLTSQSIFKTLNSKNSQLYDDFSTNVNSSKNYKHKSISSVKYNVNKVQLKGSAATLNNEELTSVNNDKRCVSLSQCNEETVETTNDDSIIKLINRIHSPVEFLTDNKINITKEEEINALKEEKINELKEEKLNALKEQKLIEETQNYKIIEAKQNLKEINTIDENIIEASVKEETCFSQYFPQKSIHNIPQKHIECSEKDTQIVSQFFSSITNKEETKKKINFSKLRKI